MLRNPIEFRVWDNNITVAVTTPLFKSTYEKLKGVNINQFVQYILETHRHILGEDYVSVNGRLIDKVIGIEEVTHEVVIAIVHTGQIETHSVTIDDRAFTSTMPQQPSGYGDHPTISRYKG